jgi:hypothetical protein
MIINSIIAGAGANPYPFIQEITQTSNLTSASSYHNFFKQFLPAGYYDYHAFILSQDYNCATTSLCEVTTYGGTEGNIDNGSIAFVRKRNNSGSGTWLGTGTVAKTASTSEGTSPSGTKWLFIPIRIYNSNDS